MDNRERKENERFMRMAIELSERNIAEGGGPFGAVIVKDGEVLAACANRVVPNNDPTAHAEVLAIREACARLKSFSLAGCTLYASCEPCPMCLSAIYWASIDRIYYANNQQDAADIDFDDSFIYDQLALKMSEREIPCVQLMRDEAHHAFEMWSENPDKVRY